MNRRVKYCIVGPLLLLAACGGELPIGGEGSDPTGPGTPPVEPPPPPPVTLTLGPSELCSGHDPDLTFVTFEDVDLADAIKNARPGVDPLTCQVVSTMPRLDVTKELDEMDPCPCGERVITSLVGIQNLTSLSELSLDDQAITDIGALSGLTSLTMLDLRRNEITDIGALSGLTSLTSLGLDDNN